MDTLEVIKIIKHSASSDPNVADPEPICQVGMTTWDSILQTQDQTQAQLIFTSIRAIESAANGLQSSILKGFKIPAFLLRRACIESNGFAGCEPGYDQEGNLAYYNHWSRFVVKQVSESLRPKPTFVRHFAPTKGVSTGRSPNINTPIHGPESVQHGWEWYEMGFFVHWTPPRTMSLLCFDLPQHLQAAIRSAVTAHAGKIDFSDPYSVFALISIELVSLYDVSTWSIRDHVSGWESKRPHQPDYPLLHEIMRHAIHVSETLTVAAESTESLLQQYEDFMAAYGQRNDFRRGASNPFRFPLQMIRGTYLRSESNKARIQNETTLAYHTDAQRNSKIQVQIGEEAKKETTAMKALAIITMTFLPATFLSSVFSMPFFSIKPSQSGEGQSLTVAGQFWVYWALAAPLSLVTLTVWFIWDKSWHKKRMDHQIKFWDSFLFFKVSTSELMVDGF